MGATRFADITMPEVLKEFSTKTGVGVTFTIKGYDLTYSAKSPNVPAYSFGAAYEANDLKYSKRDAKLYLQNLIDHFVKSVNRNIDKMAIPDKDKNKLKISWPV